MDQGLRSFLPPVSLVLVPGGSISCFSMSWILYGRVQGFFALFEFQACACAVSKGGWMIVQGEVKNGSRYALMTESVGAECCLVSWGES